MARVLLVGCEGAVVAEMLERLSLEGHDVRTASASATALDIARRWKPDLVMVADSEPATPNPNVMTQGARAGSRNPGVHPTCN